MGSISQIFYTEQMQKIRIIALENKKYGIIAELHKMGVLDIRKSSLQLNDDKALPNIQIISKELIKIRSALTFLDKPKNIVEINKMEHKSLEEVLNLSNNTKPLVNRIFSLVESKRSFLEENNEINNNLKNISLFIGTGINLKKIKSESLEFFAIIVNNKKNLRILHALKSASVNYENIIKKINKNTTLFFIIFDKRDKQKIENIINNYADERIELNDKLFDDYPENIIKKLNIRKVEIKKQVNKINNELQDISKKNYHHIAAILEMIEIEYERSKIPENFKKTEKTFIIEGWVPIKKVNKLMSVLENLTNGDYYFEEIKTNELAPTLLNRPSIFKPFDYLMGFYSLPRSDEIDPTWIFIFSFMIFYGLMISDIGYGILSLIIALLIMKKVSKEGLVYNVSKIWALSSIPVIIFGLLSNQVFGYSLSILNSIQIINWNRNIPSIIVFTVLVGVFYVILGQILSFFNKYKHHEKKLAVSKLISIVTIITGTVAIAGFLFHSFSIALSETSAITALITFEITAILSGKEASELTNLISHPLSFTRILGFGLASIIIASLIDKAFTPTLSSFSIVNVLIFIVLLIILLILHILNVIVGMFEGIVQGARLNLVEFFSKFYIGNGIKFKPYSEKRQYTYAQKYNKNKARVKK